MSHDIEMLWDHKGNVCCVIRVSLGHRCGYVGIGEKHPLYGVDYRGDSPVLKDKLPELLHTPIGKRGILSVFCWDGEKVSPEIFLNVHGGITYSGGGSGYPTPTAEPTWWFGFDCAHYGDTPEKCSLEYCIAECNSLSEQLNEVSEIAN